MFFYPADDRKELGRNSKLGKQKWRQTRTHTDLQCLRALALLFDLAAGKWRVESEITEGLL
jgi:hypothetical protein